MSDLQHPATPPPAAQPHESDVNMKMVLIVGIVSLVIFAISAVIASVALDKYTDYLHRKNGPPAPTREVGRAEIGIVDQVTFQSDHRLEKWQAQKTHWLKTYGWVDQHKGIVHVPIETAMREVVESVAVFDGLGGAR